MFKRMYNQEIRKIKVNQYLKSELAAQLFTAEKGGLLKNWILFFNHLSLMKKTFLSIVTTVTVGTFLVLGFSFFSNKSPQIGSSGLSLENLVAKAQTAVKQQVGKGRYFHQKIKLTELHPELNLSNPYQTYISDDWIDDQTQNSLYAYIDEKAGNNKIGLTFFFKNGLLSIYNSDGSLAQQEARSQYTREDMRKIAGALDNFLQGNKTDLSELNAAFNDEFGLGEALTNYPGSSMHYAGQTTFNGKKVEKLVYQYYPNKPDDVTILYFDANTFEFAGSQNEFIDRRTGQKMVQSTLEVLETDYSNQPPTIQVGSTALTLDPNVATPAVKS